MVQADSWSEPFGNWRHRPACSSGATHPAQRLPGSAAEAAVPPTSLADPGDRSLSRSPSADWRNPAAEYNPAGALSTRDARPNAKILGNLPRRLGSVYQGRHARPRAARLTASRAPSLLDALPGHRLLARHPFPGGSPRDFSDRDRRLPGRLARLFALTHVPIERADAEAERIEGPPREQVRLGEPDAANGVTGHDAQRGGALQGLLQESRGFVEPAVQGVRIADGGGEGGHPEREVPVRQSSSPRVSTAMAWGGLPWRTYKQPRLIGCARTVGLPLEPELLVWCRKRIALDQAHPRLCHPRTDAPDEAKLVDRRVHRAVVEDSLDLVKEQLAFA
jgi:hypothetical protein